jgi:hypothetical protein
MKYLILLASLAVLPAFGQNWYIASSASTTALTIQQPSTQALEVSFPQNGTPGAWVSCSAAQTATLSWNGTAATATAGTAKLIPPTVKPPNATIWTASNVGTGTVAATYPIAAGGSQNIDLSKYSMGANGTGNNITVSTTGNCTISFMWQEKQ